jgi:phosphoribosylformimino-5-aminoimidazole carboxamide ribotide isomerase
VNLYPAIDLRGGQVVRLRQGDYDQQKVYGDDPVAVARGYADAGTTWIHVVDLDAARGGGGANLRVIEEICIAVDVHVQTGGGVRSVDDATERFAAGVARVVVGSAAVENPELVDQLAAMAPGQVAVGLDARGRDVATHGWQVATGVDLLDLVTRFDRSGVGALVVTEIGRDGMLQGPDVDGLQAVVAQTSLPVIASGGVATLDDLHALAKVEIDGKRLEGAIVGTALYEGRFGVEEAIAACSHHA